MSFPTVATNASALLTGADKLPQPVQFQPNGPAPETPAPLFFPGSVVPAANLEDLTKMIAHYSQRAKENTEEARRIRNDASMNKVQQFLDGSMLKTAKEMKSEAEKKQKDAAKDLKDLLGKPLKDAKKAIKDARKSPWIKVTDEQLIAGLHAQYAEKIPAEHMDTFVKLALEK